MPLQPVAPAIAEFTTWQHLDNIRKMSNGAELG